MESIEQSTIKKNRYYSIDIMKMVCSLLVSGIHAELFLDINRPLSELFNGAFGRIGVPFFACVSGYFFFKSEINGQKVLIHQVLSLLKYYLMFSAVYIFWEFLIGAFPAVNIIEMLSIIGKRFLFYGTYYHLWFFPCMIYALVAVHFARKKHIVWGLVLLSIVGYLFDALTYSWEKAGRLLISDLDRLIEWFDFEYIRRFVGLILPFVLLGLFILHTSDYWTEKCHDRILWIGWGASLAINLTETAIVLRSGIARGTTVTFTLMPPIYFTFMLGLRYPLAHQKKLGGFCRNVSIVIYGLHPLFLECLPKVLPFHLSQTPLWGIAIGLCILIGWLVQNLFRRNKTTL